MSVSSKSVEDLVTDAIVVDSFMTVAKTSGIMKENGVYEVFVQVGNKIGIASIRDLLKAKRLVDSRIESFLKYVPKMSRDSDFFRAVRFLADHRLRSLPIVEDGRIIGKFDMKEVLKQIKDSKLGNIRAAKIMTGSPISIDSGDKIGKARGIMIRRRIDHLPVTEKKTVVGLLTSSHIFFNLMPTLMGGRYVWGVPDSFNPLDLETNVVMDHQWMECDPQDPIRDVTNRMLEQESTYCLVMLGKELQGIITFRDFSKLISDVESIVDVPVYMIGLPDDPFEAEAAKMKFTRTVRTLSKSIPSIIEARSNIKISRRRYEVSASIRTPKDSFHFKAEGWKLPAIFDEIANSMKKVMLQGKRSKTGRVSRR